MQSDINSLHRAYNNCLVAKVDEWMSMAPVQKQEAWAKGTDQFCIDERKRYLNFIEKNAPVEFKNIMRLEQGNYWASTSFLELWNTK